VRTRYVIASLAAATIGLAGSAAADFAIIGGPEPGNSWEQRISNQGVMMDFIGVVMKSSGDSFESSTFNDFNSAGAGWATTGENEGGVFPTVAIAEGPATSNDILFDIKFAGPTSNPLTFDIFGFLNGTLVADNEFIWNGSSFTVNSSASMPLTQQELSNLIPLPHPFAMGAAGLVGLAGLRRRRLA